MTDDREQYEARKQIANEAREAFSGLGKINSVGFLKQSDKWCIRLTFEDPPPPCALPETFRGYTVLVEEGAFEPLSERPPHRASIVQHGKRRLAR